MKYFTLFDLAATKHFTEALLGLPPPASASTSSPSQMPLQPGQSCSILGWCWIQAPIGHRPRYRSTARPYSPGSTAFVSRPRRPPGPHKPLLLLYALARLKHDRQRGLTFNATEAIVNPLLRSYGPWGSGAYVLLPLRALGQ
jgi:hypothetical protein